MISELKRFNENEKFYAITYSRVVIDELDLYGDCNKINYDYIRFKTAYYYYRHTPNGIIDIVNEHYDDFKESKLISLKELDIIGTYFNTDRDNAWEFLYLITTDKGSVLINCEFDKADDRKEILSKILSDLSATKIIEINFLEKDSNGAISDLQLH